MKKLFLPLFALFLFATTLSAYDFKSGKLYYRIMTNDTAPNVHTVVVTCEKLYYSEDYVNLTHITIPETVLYNGVRYSVTGIDAYAFYKCTNLTSITIPNSVQYIGEFGLNKCGLTSLTIGTGMTYLYFYAVKGCDHLTSIIWNAKNCYFESSAFTGSTSNITSFTFGDEVEKIPNKIGLLMQNITSITIPKSVKKIEMGAFESGAFTKTNYTGSIADWCNITFEYLTANPIYRSNNLYINDIEVTEVVIPEDIKSIGDYTFAGFSAMSSVSIPNSVKSIGLGSFQNCSGLTSIDIPNSITSIGGSAFSGCTGLISVAVPNGVAIIGWQAFSNCSGLTAVTLPNSITDIESRAFSGCNSLTSVISYAMVPPTCDTTAFNGLYETATLYVPCSALEDYVQAETWNRFKDIRCISSETVDIPNQTASVTPLDNEVTLTWPTEENARMYTIVLSKDGVKFCTLTFNAGGQLMNIAYAPARERQNPCHASAAEMTVNGMRFTVTGLESNTQYTYIVTVTNNDGGVLQEYKGAFTTLSATSIVNTSADKALQPTTKKIFRDGQVLIRRDGKVYTVTGIQLAE